MVMASINPEEEPILEEYGRTTIDGLTFNNIFDDKNPDIELEKLHLMYKTDGQISGLWRMLTTPIRSSGVQLMKPNGRSGREYDFISSVLFDKDNSTGMRISIEDVVSTALRMLLDGWSPHEIVWKIDENSMVRVDKIAHRSPRTIQIKVNRYGEIESYIQKKDLLHQFVNFSGDDTVFSSDIVIPRQKVLHFVHGKEWNSIFGRSMFLQPYYHFEKKHKLYYISHMAAQIRALRLRVLRSPASAGQKKSNAVLEAVSRLGFNTTIQLPDGFELDFPELGKTDDDGVLSLIQHHDVQMSKSVLSQVIDIGVEGRTGSFNLSETHLDIFIMNLELISRYIADVINRELIPKLIDWNFGTGNYPTLEFTPFQTEERRQMYDLFTRIAGAAQLNISPEFRLSIEQAVSEQLKFDISYDDISQREIDATLATQAAELAALTATIEKTEAETENIGNEVNTPEEAIE